MACLRQFAFCLPCRAPGRPLTESPSAVPLGHPRQPFRAGLTVLDVNRAQGDHPAEVLTISTGCRDAHDLPVLEDLIGVHEAPLITRHVSEDGQPISNHSG